MNHNVLFLKKFLRHGTNIASAVPSSRWLAAKTISNVDWKKTRVIVELGAGTGPITDMLAKHAEAGCKLIIIERDTDFLRILKGRFSAHSNIEVIGGNACSIQGILSARGIQKVDHIISGLPTPSLSKEDQRRLFAGVRATLTPGGSFNQLTEIPLIYLGYYRRWFRDVKFIFEPRNIPPAGVYI